MLRFRSRVLRFRVLGASFSRFRVLRFRDLGCFVFDLGCFVFEIWVLRASVFVFECFVFETTPQEEGITTICHAYDTFYTTTPPIPTHYLRETLRLILQENAFQFKGKDFLQTHGTAMGTKTAVSFADIFMAKIETAIIDQQNTKPLVWKRYIDDVFSLWDTNREEITTSLSMQITTILQ